MAWAGSGSIPVSIGGGRRRRAGAHDTWEAGQIAGIPEYLLGGETTRTIVVADADASALAALGETLEGAGYEVLRAGDGNQALAMVRDNQPDVLIGDRDLPGIDGLELCRRVKDDPATSATFVIMLSGDADKAVIVEALDEGVDECLAKPPDSAELLARIRAGLRVVELQTMLSMRNDELREATARLNEDFETIARIQKAMLPQTVPHSDAVEFTSFYLPSTESGGDYYDLVQLDDTHQGLVIADVSGHGAPAMVAMALIRQSFRLFAPDFGEPHGLLEKLNQLLYDHLPTDQYATMHYGMINTETLVYRYSSAGHNPPLWYRSDRRTTATLEKCEGFPLKLVTREATYETSQIQLKPGDMLVYYTDGIPECFSPANDAYGMERLEEVVTTAGSDGETPRQLESAIVSGVLGFADGRPPEDDLTLAILGVNSEQQSPTPEGT